VTLVEMLVTVAILVIVMTILVQVFQAATGAVSAAQAYQQIDDQLRRVDGLIRSDLEGVTAKFTPPLDPSLGLGYFEYGENEFADVQGEDSDDYIRFTAKAPEGRPFTGRMWITGTAGFTNLGAQPVTVTSDFAEIIYFLRNGNLYRRVLLVAPQLQSSIAHAIGNRYYQVQANGTSARASFDPTQGFGGGINVSWQGVNDISARPIPRTGAYNMANAPAGSTGPRTIMLNTLGDLTNRENRFASPRFSDDFVELTFNPTPPPNALFLTGPDGIADDQNSDNVPDCYPTLYPGSVPGFLAGNAPQDQNGNQIQLIYEPLYGSVPRPALGFMAFPFVFPGAYSVPQILSNYAFGWIHSPSPYANVPQGNGNCQAYKFEDNPLAYLQSINHNPLDIGDNLPTPTTPPINQGKIAGITMAQTWWGFPTWRETLSPNWIDPTWQVNDHVNTNPATGNARTYAQPAGLTYRSATTAGPNNTGVADDSDLLPPMAVPANWPAADAFNVMRRTSQLFCDGLGDQSYFMGYQAGPPVVINQFPMWSSSWEDDLVMTGVRSFDVKAYENSTATYADLGWGDDVRLMSSWASAGFLNAAGATATPANPVAPFLQGSPDFSYLWTGNKPLQTAIQPPLVQVQGVFTDYINQTFAHEGRMPPLIEDNRLDAQFPNPTYVGLCTPFTQPLGSTFTQSFVQQYGTVTDPVAGNYSYANYSSNVGDDNPAIMRLRRVWDSWSTEYTKAPANGVYNNPNAPSNAAVPDPLNNTPWGPIGSTPPIYPSYPPPYPAPLRGIQIQIRAVDPTNQRIKSLTIRQDFTDKL
jgi:type II secretory pathway pseudopilin PulG